MPAFLMPWMLARLFMKRPVLVNRKTFFSTLPMLGASCGLWVIAVLSFREKTAYDLFFAGLVVLSTLWGFHRTVNAISRILALMTAPFCYFILFNDMSAPILLSLAFLLCVLFWFAGRIVSWGARYPRKRLPYMVLAMLAICFQPE